MADASRASKRFSGALLPPNRNKMAPPRTNSWTDAQDAELKRLAASGTNRLELAHKLNRSVSAVEARAYKLKIQLPPAFLPKRTPRPLAK